MPKVSDDDLNALQAGDMIRIDVPVRYKPDVNGRDIAVTIGGSYQLVRREQIADIVSQRFEVGDAVKGFDLESGTILAIHKDWAWIEEADGNFKIRPMRDLKRLPSVDPDVLLAAIEAAGKGYGA